MGKILKRYYPVHCRSGIIACLLTSMTLFLISCFENPERPKLTNEISGYIENAILIRSSVTSDGGSDVIQKGVCWGMQNNPEVGQDLLTNDGSGKGSYESLIMDLYEPGTYYIRSYAINGAGVGYGNELTYSVIGVYFDYYGEISATSALFRTNVISPDEVISKGVCWSTSAYPDIEDSHTDAGPGAGTFTVTITGLIPGTTYYVRPYAQNQEVIFYGNEVTIITASLPDVATKQIMNYGTFIVTSGGDILNNHGSAVIKAGVCWSTSPSPTIEDMKTEDWITFDSFYSDLYGLQPGQTYYVRAYATTYYGTGYGGELMIIMPEASVIDLSGNPYTTVVVGSQEWMLENLKTKKFSNGDNIRNITDITEWQHTSSPAWSYFENDNHYESPYGILYNWYAVSDPRNICPAGWHVPTDEDWATLIDYLGGSEFAGEKLKESGYSHWDNAGVSSSNSSGFTALPGGSKNGVPAGTHLVRTSGLFWSTTETDLLNAMGYGLHFHINSIEGTAWDKHYGFSVRCIKD